MAALIRSRPGWVDDVTAAQHCPTGVMETLMTTRQKHGFNQGFGRLTSFCRKLVIFRDYAQAPNL